MNFDISHFDSEYWFTVCLSIFLSIGIILHSFWINRTNWKKRGWHFVRACTEISSFSALLSCLMIVLASIYSNPAETALFYDFIYGGVAFAVIQLCDNYLCVNRYRAVVRKIPTWKMITIQSYIIIVLTSTWLPAYTIVPFFYDTNSNTFWIVYNNLLLIQGWGAVLFNFYFTLEFVVFLQRANFRSPANISSRVSRNKLIAVKSIIHCITSSVANLIAMYFLVEGALVYIISIPLGLHFLFNCKTEILFGFGNFKLRTRIQNQHFMASEPQTRRLRPRARENTHQIRRLRGNAQHNRILGNARQTFPVEN